MNWTTHYFRHLYGELYRRYFLTEDRTREEVAFVESVLETPGKAVLDLASGFGRHARLLARKATVVALDQNREYLVKAASGLRGAASRQLKPLQGDMRALPLADQRFDVVLLLFNSFGYFSDAAPQSSDPSGQIWRLPNVFYERDLVDRSFDQRVTDNVMDEPRRNADSKTDDNQTVLNEMARVLKPGGEVLVELPNRQSVVAAVRSDPRRHVMTARYSIEEEYSFDEGRSVLSNRTRFRMGDLTEEGLYHLRLYTRGDIQEMMRKAGLRLVRTYGDYVCARYNARRSDMMLVVGRRSG